jgi:hypothetical protein
MSSPVIEKDSNAVQTSSASNLPAQMLLEIFENSPFVNLSLEMLLEIFQYLSNEEVLTKLPCVSRKVNEIVQLHSVYVDNLVLITPSVNLLKSLANKVMGCIKSFDVRLMGTAGDYATYMAMTCRMKTMNDLMKTEEMKKAFDELFNKLESSVN